MIDRLELLSTLTDEHLSAMLEAFRALALSKNRVALDLFCIIEKEMLRRYESTRIEDYSDDEIATALLMFTDAIDVTRAAGVPDDSPPVRFLLVTLTDLAGEVESRGLVQRVQ